MDTPDSADISSPHHDAAAALHPAMVCALHRRAQAMQQAERRSPHTLRSYGRAVTEFALFLGERAGRPLDPRALFSLSLRDYRAWMASLAHLSPRSAASTLSAVRSFAASLEREGVITASSVTSLRFPRKSALLPKPLAHAEFERLRERWCEVFPLDDEAILIRDHALLTLLYGAGLRISEALQFSLRDVTPSVPAALSVEGKGRKTRHVPCIAPVREALEALVLVRRRETGSDPEAPLFAGAKGKRLQDSVVRARMSRARAFIQAPESATPHALRHAYATELLAADPSKIRVLQELLGHASLSVTQIYAKVRPGAAAAACMMLHPRAVEKEEA